MSENEIFDAMMRLMPYAQTMGMRVHAMEEDALVCHMPFDESHIGNVELPAIHGGALSSFMEMAATVEVARRQLGQMNVAANADMEQVIAHVPVPLNVTVQYLRSAKDQDCYVRAEVLKLGRRSNTVLCRLWQEDESKPVASMTGIFVSQG